MSATKRQTNERHQASTTKFRLQWEVDKPTYCLIEEIKDDTSIETTKDLCAYAITLFVWAVREAEAGRSVGSYDEKTEKLRIFQMPPLMKAAERAKMKSGPVHHDAA